MKIEAAFTERNHSLVEISSGAEFDCDKIQFVSLPWDSVEPGAEEEYDEAYLAGLRQKLKELEEEPRSYAALAPLAGTKASLLQEEGGSERYAAAVRHAARRLKDCAAVIGVRIPEELTHSDDVKFLMEGLLQKHKHYVFFASEREFLQDLSVIFI